MTSSLRGFAHPGIEPRTFLSCTLDANPFQQQQEVAAICSNWAVKLKIGAQSLHPVMSKVFSPYANEMNAGEPHRFG